jgi:hypothetical protein
VWDHYWWMSPFWTRAWANLIRFIPTFRAIHLDTLLSQFNSVHTQHVPSELSIWTLSWASLIQFTHNTLLLSPVLILLISIYLSLFPVSPGPFLSSMSGVLFLFSEAVVRKINYNVMRLWKKQSPSLATPFPFLILTQPGLLVRNETVNFWILTLTSYLWSNPDPLRDALHSA